MVMSSRLHFGAFFWRATFDWQKEKEKEKEKEKGPFFVLLGGLGEPTESGLNSCRACKSGLRSQTVCRTEQPSTRDHFCHSKTFLVLRPGACRVAGRRSMPAEAGFSKGPGSTKTVARRRGYHG
jgi:hypothetical protein